MMPKAFPELFTDRLLLRQLRESDSHSVYMLRSDPEVNRFVVRKTPADQSAALDFILKINEGVKEGKWIYWALVHKKKRQLIGTISLWNFSEDGEVAEIGFDLKSAYQGKGYMTAALRAIITYGFSTLKLKKIDA